MTDTPVTFQCSLTPRFTDLDTWRHVNNSRIYQLQLNRGISKCERLIMKSIQFSRWIAQLSTLNPEQRNQLRSCLSGVGGPLQGVIKVPRR